MFDKCKKIKGFFNHKHQLRTEKKALKEKVIFLQKAAQRFSASGELIKAQTSLVKQEQGS